ncbi:hypothetical protein GWI33_008267 [Rhynchophorus ferrugineus]|uniref:Uncharacterized protein n=1 Tax=Rhynchophorus ferrugineus TaxID=354439 RepID=A0A834MKQ6_RHYFE|nr:hypothetical protein GWI33_008267 [Rhynchophorus ferrugineus]
MLQETKATTKGHSENTDHLTKLCGTVTLGPETSQNGVVEEDATTKEDKSTFNLPSRSSAERNFHVSSS